MGYQKLSNQVPGSMGSRNGNVVRGTLLKLGFNTTGTRLFPRSRNGTNVPGTRNVAKFPVPGYQGPPLAEGGGLAARGHLATGGRGVE